ncbi:MAG: SAM-dependent methyltransferase [Phycisphaerae bacterium]|nr:SAM-dependent methyltransferase [Saprospiraceae bacterium]
MLPTTQFLTAFRTAFESGQLLKCTLSKPSPTAPEGLKNLYLRPVALKKGLHVSFNFRYKTRDEVKNFELNETVAQLEKMLGTAFLNADLLTSERDFFLQFDKKGAAHFSEKKPSQKSPAEIPTAHNRPKNRLLDPTAPWLHQLGITNAKGEVLAAHQDKWRQINKYLETIESLLRDSPIPSGAHIADMGSGKGYLTFALYDFLENHLSLAPHITGIELRPGLVDFCNKTAQQVGFQNLTFVAQDIADYHPAELDMLIALHACDTATDLALAAGIRQKARIIVVAPCCHKQIRREMQAHNELAPLLHHGILEERQAEILTDGIRALLLEAEGYHTKVFEFISTEHTAKNVMITATRSGQLAGRGDSRLSGTRREKALSQVAALKAGFGIREHWLEKLLAK